MYLHRILQQHLLSHKFWTCSQKYWKEWNILTVESDLLKHTLSVNIIWVISCCLSFKMQMNDHSWPTYLIKQLLKNFILLISYVNTTCIFICTIFFFHCQILTSFWPIYIAISWLVKQTKNALTFNFSKKMADNFQWYEKQFEILIKYLIIFLVMFWKVKLWIQKKRVM